MRRQSARESHLNEIQRVNLTFPIEIAFEGGPKRFPTFYFVHYCHFQHILLCALLGISTFITLRIIKIWPVNWEFGNIPTANARGTRRSAWGR